MMNYQYIKQLMTYCYLSLCLPESSYSHKTGLPILPKIRIYHNSVGLLFSIQKKHTSSGLEVGGIVNNFDMKLKKGFWYVKGTNNRYNEVWKKTEP